MAKKLVGTFNPAEGGDGFCLAVFSEDGGYYVQETDSGGFIKGFSKITIDRDLKGSTFSIEKSVGEGGLYAFEHLDVVHIGSKNEISEILRPAYHKLTSSPFLSYEIAQFLEDRQLQDASLDLIRQQLKRDGSSTNVQQKSDGSLEILQKAPIQAHPSSSLLLFEPKVANENPIDPILRIRRYIGYTYVVAFDVDLADAEATLSYFWTQETRLFTVIIKGQPIESLSEFANLITFVKYRNERFVDVGIYPSTDILYSKSNSETFSR